MRLHIRAFVWATLILCAAGCSTDQREVRRDSWLASAQGEAARLRAERVAATLLKPLSLPKPIRIEVLPSAAPNAFSWPDGHMAVTQGLLDLVTDDELAAALAHELGHLLQDGHVTVAALQGLPVAGGAGSEVKADAWGCRVLHARGVPTSNMASMLEKVAAHLPDDPSRAASLAARAAVIRQADPR